ncbi:MAG: hypothetical protein HY703_00915 [Gemmatimonadetes bacterium]|nr:hypothetical protein [Gemmatimonadota bacterium]
MPDSSRPRYANLGVIRHPHLLLAAALTIELAAFLTLAQLGDLAWRVPAFLALSALAAIGYAAGLAALRRRPVRLAVILLAGLVLRAPLLPTTPSLSDDVWRYLHDGRMQLAGVNPYRYAPADPATVPFRGPEHAHINHPTLPTIYPPAAQLAFLAAAALGASVPGWKLLLLLAELALALALAALLRARGLPVRRVALYAWHPLPVIEVAGSAHLEPLALAPLFFALALAAAARHSRAAALLGLAAAARYFAAPIAPFLDRRHPLRAASLAAAALAALYLPYLPGAGRAVLGSLGTYARTWEFNPAGHLALAALLGSAAAARALAGILLALLLVWLWRRGTRAEDAGFSMILALLLVSPVVHPWYLLWLLPFLPLREVRRDGTTLAAWAWTLTVLLSYTVLGEYRRSGVWEVPGWAALFEYTPVLGLLGWSAVRAVRRGSPRSARAPAG